MMVSAAGAVAGIVLMRGERGGREVRPHEWGVQVRVLAA